MRRTFWVSVADAKNKLPELCRRGHPVVDIVWTRAPNSRPRKFGTMRGKIKIHDHNWWRPMTHEEVNAFLEGPY